MPKDSITDDDDHIAVLDMKSAYDMVNRHKPMQRCRGILPADLCEMICLKLSNVKLGTLGYPSPTTAKCWIDVIQGPPSSLILFNIYIGCLAVRLCAVLTPTPSRLSGRHVEDNCLIQVENATQLQQAQNICAQWAKNFDMIWYAKKSLLIHPDDQKRTTGSGSVHTALRIDARPIQKTQATRHLGVDLMPKSIGAKYTLEGVTPFQRRLRDLVYAKHINSEMPPAAVRMVYNKFVRSMYEYEYALTAVSPKIICEVTKLENSFFSAILQMRFSM